MSLLGHLYNPSDEVPKALPEHFDPNKTLPVNMSPQARKEFDAYVSKGNEKRAKKLGFKNVEQADAYYKKRQETLSGPGGRAPASSGSLLDQIFALHPMVLLKQVLDNWNKADGTEQ